MKLTARGGFPMPVLILFAHKVKDYDRWRVGFDANRQTRIDHQMVEQFVGRDSRDPNVVHVGLMAPSLDAARRFVSRPELRDGMASAGVSQAPDIRFVVIE
jgi:hypothetical protein